MDALSLKAIVIIVASVTGTDNYDNYIFEKPTFKTVAECKSFVRDNFVPLNMHVNKEYKMRLDTPNLFYCIEKERYIRFLKEVTKEGTQI